MSQPTKVIVIGGSGNIGRPILHELLTHPSTFHISVLTRPTSSNSVPFDPRINTMKAEYILPSLTRAFTGQEIIICAISTYSLGEQMKIAPYGITDKFSTRGLLCNEFDHSTSVVAS